MKRLMALMLMCCTLAMLGGCVYPAYYQRPGVVYDDGSRAYPENGRAYQDNGAAVAYDDGYYAPGYYYGPSYGPWCCYGYAYPWFGFGFFGSYSFHGGGHWHGGGHSWHGGHH